MTQIKYSGGVAHIGLGKTGSTYLQRHYFSKLNLSFFSTESPFEWPQALNFIREGNTLWYHDINNCSQIFAKDARQDFYRKKIQLRLNKWLKNTERFKAEISNEQPWIISAEGLCGLSSDICALHMPLLQNAGISKIIFITRKQVDYAQSLWRQFLLKEDRFAKFVPFEILFGNGEETGIVELDWNQYIKSMDTCFGNNNVLVLPYELMTESPLIFVDRINRFLEIAPQEGSFDTAIRENMSRMDPAYYGLLTDHLFSSPQLSWARKATHRIAKKIPNYTPKFIKKRYSMNPNPELLARLKHSFRESNKRLEERMEINLGDFGYY